MSYFLIVKRHEYVYIVLYSYIQYVLLYNSFVLSLGSPLRAVQCFHRELLHCPPPTAPRSELPRRHGPLLARTLELRFIHALIAIGVNGIEDHVRNVHASLLVGGCAVGRE